MRKKVLVTGKTGQLGQSINKIAANYPNFDFTFVGRDELDLSESSSIERFFNNKSFDAIVNCAAYTAVDKAETETELADQINHLAVGQMAAIAKQQNAYFIHLSTDYVFDGTNSKPYQEIDTTNPINVYGLTKLKGEQAVRLINPRGVIIRTAWVYSEFGNNFVKTMLRLGKERDSLNVIADQVGTPTYATDLARVIMKIVLTEVDRKIQLETYHYSNDGVCSWYDFAKTIFELADITCKVNPIETKDYPAPARRPHYSILNKNKINLDYCLTRFFWKDSLVKCILNIMAKNNV